MSAPRIDFDRHLVGPIHRLYYVPDYIHPAEEQRLLDEARASKGKWVEVRAIMHGQHGHVHGPYFLLLCRSPPNPLPSLDPSTPAIPCMCGMPGNLGAMRLNHHVRSCLAVGCRAMEARCTPRVSSLGRCPRGCGPCSSGSAQTRPRSACTGLEAAREKRQLRHPTMCCSTATDPARASW